MAVVYVAEKPMFLSHKNSFALQVIASNKEHKFNEKTIICISNHLDLKHELCPLLTFSNDKPIIVCGAPEMHTINLRYLNCYPQGCENLKCAQKHIGSNFIVNDAVGREFWLININSNEKLKRIREALSKTSLSFSDIEEAVGEPFILYLTTAGMTDDEHPFWAIKFITGMADEIKEENKYLFVWFYLYNVLDSLFFNSFTCGSFSICFPQEDTEKTKLLSDFIELYSKNTFIFVEDSSKKFYDRYSWLWFKWLIQKKISEPPLSREFIQKVENGFFRQGNMIYNVEKQIEKMQREKEPQKRKCNRKKF